MSPIEYDPAYSAGVRTLLVRTATSSVSRRRRRIWMGAGLVAGLSVLGAGGAIAATSLLPGQDSVRALSSPRTVTGVGTTRIVLERAPEATNSIQVELGCLTTGTLRWPDGSSSDCDTAGGTASGSIPWTPDRSTFDLGATAGTRWRLTYSFSHHRPTSFATNAAGQTYGVGAGARQPDLIAAIATNGRQGYISAKEEAAADPCRRVRNPTEAVRCTQEYSGRSVSIPVYESDGRTRIGVFTIGG